MKKNPEKQQITKSALKNAFWTLYQDKPIEKVTVQEIAKLAEYNRSTFYQYYSDVYAVLDEIENDVIKDWELLIFEIPINDAINQHKISEIVIETIAAFYERNGIYISVLLSPKGDPSFIRRFKDVMRHKIFSILQIPNDNIEVSLIFEFLSSGMLAFFTAWYLNARCISSKDAVILLHSLLFEDKLKVLLGKISD